MSPFSELLRTLRIARGLRQGDFANEIGYPQSYISGLELGIKGPPNETFLQNLADALNLSEEEREEVLEAVAASQKHIVVPVDASSEVYVLCHQLGQQLDRLHPTQINLIRTALTLPIVCNLSDQRVVSRIKRRDAKTTHKEGAEMK